MGPRGVVGLLPLPKLFLWEERGEGREKQTPQSREPSVGLILVPKPKAPTEPRIRDLLFRWEPLGFGKSTEPP